ncbi:RhoGAP domain-containing protein [Apiospora phragmitis]|uniref:RhoGAP domain-containing protein n=1 Tax=Apiospora phragmitis TaxID=2905665 RepID=A0ABR1TRM9_9PEZI
MTSAAATPSKPLPQQQAQPAASTNAASPPSKRDLKSWWKRFQLQSRHQESQDWFGFNPWHRSVPSTSPVYACLPACLVKYRNASRLASGSRLDHIGFYSGTFCPRFLAAMTLGSCADYSFSTEARQQGIFGVPLRQSITYANVAISLVDDNGQSYIYGYVPIVVAKCGVFLKEKATGIEGIFRLSGSEKRIKELKVAFDSPDRYGKGLVWDGYTVHDAANVLRRYLNDLPEPVVPLDLYEKFRDPLRGHTKQAVGDIEGSQLVDNFDEAEAIKQYQDLIKALPPLNRQLLLYILDLLAVFAAKADENRMTAQNLAAIFQPGMLSHPNHAMAPEEYRLNQCVIIFLIENQDHFLIGMPGTAADEKTKQVIEKYIPAPPVVVSPSTPAPKRSASGVYRSSSNASAAADSVSRDGKIRRNRSTSSRHSRHSNGASTPGSPGLATTPGGSLGRSNTVPSKKSPHIPSAHFQRHESSSVAVDPASPTPAGLSAGHPPTVKEEVVDTSEKARTTAGSTLMPAANPAGRSQDRLLEPPMETPGREKNLPNLFQRSPAADSEKRQPNKLRKKRLPSSANPSAQSSTASLPHYGTKAARPEPSPTENGASTETPSEPTPRASQVPATGVLDTAPAQQEAVKTLKPKGSPPGSLHSSYNEGGSDLDHAYDSLPAPTAEQAEQERKRRWRFSRRKEEIASAAAAQNQNLGVNSHAETSTSTVGSGGHGHRPRKSWTGESSDIAATLAESEAGSRDARDEARGPLGWIKTKYREVKENHDQKRTKSPPGDYNHGPLPIRGKSVEMKREEEERRGPSAVEEATQKSVQPQNVPLPMSPPPVPTTHEERARAS